MGSATLKSSEPMGSSTRRHRMVDTYWVMMSLVSAPGWRRRFLFLLVRFHDTDQRREGGGNTKLDV